MACEQMCLQAILLVIEFFLILFLKGCFMAIQDKYINPFTDFGFKKLFGSEPNRICSLIF